MEDNNNIMYFLGEYLIDDADNMASFYDSSMELIYNYCIEKKNPLNRIINLSDLSNEQRDLYILKFALINNEVFSYLEYIWNIVYNKKITQEFIKMEVSKLI